MPVYAGINGVARKLKEWPVGIGGVVHQQKEVWAGVDGVSKKIFTIKTNPILTVTGSGTLMSAVMCYVEVKTSVTGQTVKKITDGPVTMELTPGYYLQFSAIGSSNSEYDIAIYHDGVMVGFYDSYYWERSYGLTPASDVSVALSTYAPYYGSFGKIYITGGK